MEAMDRAALPPLRATARCYSLAFLRRRATKRATRLWKEDIDRRNAGRRTFRPPTYGDIPPRHQAPVEKGHQEVAARFFQLLSGHSMTAPFLRDRWGWVDSDRCWWCEKSRQSRDHLFKECAAWTNETRELWKVAGEASGKRGEGCPFQE